MIYGGTLPALAATYQGLVNGDGASAIQGLTVSTVPASSHVGSYTITASGGSDADYSITLQNGTLNVTPASLIITADNQSKDYGQVDPALTAGFSGFVNGDSVAVLNGRPDLSTSAALYSTPGAYTITAGPSSLADPDYAFHFVNGTLTVNKAPTSTALIATATTPLAGVDTVTFTASVAVDAPGSGNPTGSGSPSSIPPPQGTLAAPPGQRRRRPQRRADSCWQPCHRGDLQWRRQFPGQFWHGFLDGPGSGQPFGLRVRGLQ